MKRQLFLLIIFILTHLSVFAEETHKYGIDELTAFMLENSLELKIDELETQKKHNDYKSSLGRLMPNVKYGLSAYFFANPIDPVRLSYSEISGLIPGTATSIMGADGYAELYPGSEKTYYSAGISLVQPIETGGKLYNYTEINKELYNISRQKHSMDVRKNINELKACAECFAYLSEMEKNLLKANNDADELIKLSEEYEKAGMITRAKNLETATAAYKVRAGFQTVKSQKDSQLERIRTITGKYDLRAEEIDISMPELEYYADILKEDRLKLVSASVSPQQEALKIRAMTERIAALNEKIKTASLPFAPDVFLYASLSYATPRFPVFETDWYGQGDWQATLAISLSGTLFDGLSQYRNLESSRLDKKIESERTKETLRKIESDFLSSLNSIETAVAQIHYRNAELEEKKQILSDAALAFEQGSISRFDYLATEIQEAASEVELHKEYIKLLVNYYIVTYFTGGAENE